MTTIVLLAAILSAAVLLSANPSKNDDPKLWAVLVAGSSEYYNYRHQADICHAYQILKSHGIPDEQIIVMQYDDIAYDTENPTPGILINKPGGGDVYAGALKDYTGSQVTPQNFLNILLGNAAAMKGIGSGKVLKSGPNDHVFINFADHGGPGILAFPDDELDVQDFITTLKSMNTKKLYKKLVLYVEACESGSMFKDVLPSNINIYASTAANDVESSYACYWDDLRETYLGDLYSVNWMEDTDAEDITTETITRQFNIVRRETNLSHVQEYGDLTIAALAVGEFQGENVVPHGQIQQFIRNIDDAVPAPDVPLHAVMRKLQKASANSEKSLQLQKDLHNLKKNRVYLDNKVEAIVKKSVSTPEQVNFAINERLSLANLDCHSEVTKYFSKNCFKLSKNDYSLRKIYVLVNMCEMGVKPKVMKKAMDLVCTHPPIYGIH